MLCTFLVSSSSSQTFKFRLSHNLAIHYDALAFSFSSCPFPSWRKTCVMCIVGFRTLCKGCVCRGGGGAVKVMQCSVIPISTSSRQLKSPASRPHFSLFLYILFPPPFSPGFSPSAYTTKVGSPEVKKKKKNTKQTNKQTKN